MANTKARLLLTFERLIESITGQSAESNEDEAEINQGDYDYLFKVLLISNYSDVSKYLFLSRFNSHVVDKRDWVAKEVGFHSRRLILDGKVTEAQIWDSVDHGVGTHFVSSDYYRRAKGALIVYDVNKHSTFVYAKSSLSGLRDKNPHVIVMLVGYRRDDIIIDLREVSYEEGKSFAERESLFFIETSALYEAFFKIITAIYLKTVGKKLITIQDGGRDIVAGNHYLVQKYQIGQQSEIHETNTVTSSARKIERLEKVKRIFQLFDANKDGALNRSELAALIVAVNPRFKFSEEQIEATVDRLFRRYSDFLYGEKGLTYEGLVRTYDDGMRDVDRDFNVISIVPETSLTSSIADQCIMDLPNKEETALCSLEDGKLLPSQTKPENEILSPKENHDDRTPQLARRNFAGKETATFENHNVLCTFDTREKCGASDDSSSENIEEKASSSSLAIQAYEFSVSENYNDNSIKDTIERLGTAISEILVFKDQNDQSCQENPGTSPAVCENDGVSISAMIKMDPIKDDLNHSTIESTEEEPALSSPEDGELLPSQTELEEKISAPKDNHSDQSAQVMNRNFPIEETPAFENHNHSSASETCHKCGATYDTISGISDLINHNDQSSLENRGTSLAVHGNDGVALSTIFNMEQIKDELKHSSLNTIRLSNGKPTLRLFEDIAYYMYWEHITWTENSPMASPACLHQPTSCHFCKIFELGEVYKGNEVRSEEQDQIAKQVKSRQNTGKNRPTSSTVNEVSDLECHNEQTLAIRGTTSSVVYGFGVSGSGQISMKDTINKINYGHITYNFQSQIRESMKRKKRSSKVRVVHKSEVGLQNLSKACKNNRAKEEALPWVTIGCLTLSFPLLLFLLYRRRGSVRVPFILVSSC